MILNVNKDTNHSKVVESNGVIIRVLRCHKLVSDANSELTRAQSVPGRRSPGPNLGSKQVAHQQTLAPTQES